MLCGHRFLPAAFLVSLAGLGSGCGEPKGGSEIHARRVVVQREVEGLRDLVGRLERGEPALPSDDVLVSIDEPLVKTLLEAQLPFQIDVDKYHLRLDRAELTFKGSPLVSLEGEIALRDQRGMAGLVRVLGAFDQIAINRSGALTASVEVDHIDIRKLAGLEGFLGSENLQEVARTIRQKIQGQIPGIEIPVQVQQAIDVPALTSGPVRLQAATMPLDIGVSKVLASTGRLWVAIRVKPGLFVKVAAAGRK